MTDARSALDEVGQPTVGWLGRRASEAPIATGLLVTGAGLLGWLLLEGLARRIGAASHQPAFDGVAVALLSLQAGYFVAALPLMRRRGLECIESLRPVLESSEDELRALVSRFQSVHRSNAGWALAAGAALAVVFQEVQVARFSGWMAAPGPALGELWTVAVAWAAWSLGFSSAGLVIHDALLINRLGRVGVSVDLLRTDGLAPFSRFGLQMAAVVVGVMTLWAAALVAILRVVGQSLADTYAIAGVTVLLLYVALTIAFFLVPQLGIRARIRQQKRDASEWLGRLLPAPDQAADEARVAPERLAALLSVRRQIQDAPEWPVGEHTRLRLAFYLLLPLLSWSAAALVEELVSRLIG